MTNIIRNFAAARRRAALSCVWLATGNPAQPLVCRWVVEKRVLVDAHDEDGGEPPAWRLCA
jgi:hypothetical protein